MTGELLLRCPRCKHEVALDRLKAIMGASMVRQKKTEWAIKCPKCGTEMRDSKEWQT